MNRLLASFLNQHFQILAPGTFNSVLFQSQVSVKLNIQDTHVFKNEV